MRAVKASADSETNRMFENDLFEYFSHIPPWQPPVLFVPIIGYHVWMSVLGGISMGALFGLLVLGYVHWTVMEYVLHRFAFHYRPTSAFGKRFIWILHGVHHDWPNDKMRLVFPPAVSLPLALLFWWFYSTVFDKPASYAGFAGLATGYLLYDMIHYYVHHFAPKHRVGKFLRRYHLAHHFKEPQRGFGVSNPFWDYVFFTKPAWLSAEEKKDEAVSASPGALQGTRYLVM